MSANSRFSFLPSLFNTCAVPCSRDSSNLEVTGAEEAPAHGCSQPHRSTRPFLFLVPQQPIVDESVHDPPTWPLAQNMANLDDVSDDAPKLSPTQPIVSLDEDSYVQNWSDGSASEDDIANLQNVSDIDDDSSVVLSQCSSLTSVRDSDSIGSLNFKRRKSHELPLETGPQITVRVFALSGAVLFGPIQTSRTKDIQWIINRLRPPEGHEAVVVHGVTPLYDTAKDLASLLPDMAQSDEVASLDINIVWKPKLSKGDDVIVCADIPKARLQRGQRGRVCKILRQECWIDKARVLDAEKRFCEGDALIRFASNNVWVERKDFNKLQVDYDMPQQDSQECA